ncbi:MAG TPA: alpha/beta fold hydrolase [Polyangiaceae bacterium]|nr:alpha/beta fold hydrolase [Polyangiaceae bacterium]
MTDALQLPHLPSLLESPVPWLDRTVYPFVPRFLQLAAGRVHYVDEGKGESEPIVFVHGTPSWSFEYRHLIRELSASRRCIAYDHLGFGLSERPSAFGYRPEDHARVFAEFVAALGLERFTLVVHDFGGPIALPFAEAHPERIARLVVLNSFMWPIDDPKLVQQARLAGSRLGRLLYRYLNFSLRVLMPFGYGDKRRLTPRVHAQYLAPFRARAARETVLWALARSLLGSHVHYAELWSNRERLAAIPSLVLWGTRDRFFPGDYLERWRQALPLSRVEPLSDAGHWPQEECPELVLKALLGFLAKRDAEG